MTLRYALDHTARVRRGVRSARGGAPQSRRPVGTASRDCCRCCTGSRASATSRCRAPRGGLSERIPAASRRALLEALYSEGLGEFAYGTAAHLAAPSLSDAPSTECQPPSKTNPSSRVLVPVGGGKDSAVALEIVRRTGLSRRCSPSAMLPDRATANVADLPHLVCSRPFDPGLGELNAPAHSTATSRSPRSSPVSRC